MIYVFNLANGYNVIASCNVEMEHLKDLDQAPYLTLYDPMSIERDEAGMKLRDFLMLSDNDKLTFRSNDIISYYTPTPNLVEYYKTALEYAKRYTRPVAQQQIQAAVQDLEHTMQEEDEYANKLVNILMKAGGNTLQ